MDRLSVLVEKELVGTGPMRHPPERGTVGIEITLLLLEGLVIPTRVEALLLQPLAYSVDLVGALPLEPS